MGTNNNVMSRKNNKKKRMRHHNFNLQNEEARVKKIAQGLEKLEIEARENAEEEVEDDEDDWEDIEDENEMKCEPIGKKKKIFKKNKDKLNQRRVIQAEKKRN